MSNMSVDSAISICNVAFELSEVLSHLAKGILGAQSLQPFGLRPATSLPTPNPCCYQHKLKTQYGMCQVTLFPVALSAASKRALRGAPEIFPYLVTDVLRMAEKSPDLK